MSAAVRTATRSDADKAARLLRDFNVEYDEETPEVTWLARRVGELIDEGDTTVLLAGDGPDGVAVLRFRRSLWTEGRECYLAELYVAPSRRGQGLGRALMDRVIAVARERGADGIDLGTGEGDTAARGLYASFGFVDDGGNAPGERNLFLELDL